MSRPHRARVLIMAGGTGGHVLPALEVAKSLRSCGMQVDWLGTRRGLEARLVRQSGYRLYYLSMRGVRRSGLLRQLLVPVLLGHSLLKAMLVILWRRPSLVIGFGGYVSVPGGIAAWLLRRPLVLHEQNAIAGSANRLLAPLAERVLSAFPNVLGGAVHCGNPVRPNIRRQPASLRNAKAGRKELHVLVLGGSQGAKKLNALMPAALARATAMPLAVWHQTGPRHLDATRLIYRQYKARLGHCKVRIEDYLDNIAVAYQWADLVVCRSGAMTVAELSAAGLPAVFVPFARAVDNHQWHNARHLSASGAGILAPEARLSPARLARILGIFARDRDTLMRMSERVAMKALPHASDTVVASCLGILQNRRPG